MHRKVIGIAAVAALVAAGAALAGIAIIKPYAVGIDGGYYTHRLLSVGDTVPESSNPAKQYQMIGIPDGLGAHKGSNGRTTVFMNHELVHNTLSEPVLGEPLNRGPIVSKLTLDRKGKVLSGERAYDTVYLDDTLVGPAPTVANTTPSFSRFCSASLAGREVGFDRPIYLANEESTGANTFDGKGGLAVAVFDNEAHGLTALGHFAWENALVQPNTGKYTVIMSMEDGPASQDRLQSNSQLYMYVGEKDRRGATVLERNGLVGGTLYVFRSKDPARNSESSFLSGSISGEWVSLGNVSQLTDVQLEAASDAVNAMIFARPEDGAFNPNETDEYFFVTTGGGTGNTLGRLYSLELSGKDSTGPATLKVEYNADQVIAAGGDIALSPDNLDTSRDYLMINEDGTAESRPVMASKGRDGSIWRFDLDRNGVDVSSALRVAELNQPGRDRIPVGPGVWETSGIIDTSQLFGKDTWLFDVQAHAPTTAPKPNTVEDGQLLLLVGPDDKHDDDDDDNDDDNEEDEDDD